MLKSEKLRALILSLLISFRASIRDACSNAATQQDTFSPGVNDEMVSVSD